MVWMLIKFTSKHNISRLQVHIYKKYTQISHRILQIYVNFIQQKCNTILFTHLAVRLQNFIL